MGHNKRDFAQFFACNLYGSWQNKLAHVLQLERS